jgi:transcriptional regulator with XRE-family HTH domain
MPKSVFTDAYASLLETVVEARKALGVSQVELARRLGKTQPFVSYFERGERRIDVIEFYAIMRALGVDPVEMFGELVKKLPERVEI